MKDSRPAQSLEPAQETVILSHMEVDEREFFRDIGALMFLGYAVHQRSAS